MGAKSRITAYALCLMALLALCLPARADYHYASHEGSNEYPYTSWETAAQLIQDAVDAAEPGDTVYVGEGTWSQQVEIYNNNIAIIGQGIGNSVFENYNTNYTIRIYSDSVLVEGFSFYANYTVHSVTGISCWYSGYVEIKDNYFDGNYAAISSDLEGKIINNFFYNNHHALFLFSISSELIFANNTIYRNTHLGSIRIEDEIADTSKFHIRNNLFYEGIGEEGIFYDWPTPLSDTIYIYNNILAKKICWTAEHTSFGRTKDNILFYNNSIDGESEDMGPYAIVTGIQAGITDSTRTIDNNIVINCDLGIHFNGDARYSDFFNVETYFSHEGEFLEGCIFSDPMFNDTLDFHLQAYSPCIDAGDPEVLDPDGSRSDMGAYGGPYGEYYEYQDLPPRIPDSLVAEVSVALDTIYLSWTYNTEADFNRYQFHRDTVSGFEPSVFNLIAEPDTSVYIDTDFDLQHNYYYRIAAVDNQDNISEYSDQFGVIFTGFDDFDPNLPRSVVLYQNYPNPFNQSTIIRFYLPDIGYQPAEVQLDIYDVLGRKVRRLVDERRYPGEHEAVWDGCDDNGQQLSSGVYFYRLFISKAELTKPKKLMLLR